MYGKLSIEFMCTIGRRKNMKKSKAEDGQKNRLTNLNFFRKYVHSHLLKDWTISNFDMITFEIPRAAVLYT